MQPPLPLTGLTAPPPLAWEQLAPEQRTETVSVLARLMARVVHPPTETHEEEPTHD